LLYIQTHNGAHSDRYCCTASQVFLYILSYSFTVRHILFYIQSRIVIHCVTYFSRVSVIFLKCLLHIAVLSFIYCCNRVTYFCTVSHKLLNIQSLIPVYSFIYCCTFSHIFLYGYSLISLQSFSYCCIFSHILVYRHSHIAERLIYLYSRSQIDVHSINKCCKSVTCCCIFNHNFL
jgi:hypothetical protein